MQFKVGDKISLAGRIGKIREVSKILLGFPHYVVWEDGEGDDHWLDLEDFPEVKILEPKVTFSEEQIEAIMRFLTHPYSWGTPTPSILFSWLNEHKEK